MFGVLCGLFYTYRITSKWEEKKSMKQNLSFKTLEDVGEENITKETENRVSKNEWILIGEIKSWIRKCKHCGNIVQHTNHDTYSSSIRFNKKCEKCRQPCGKKNSFYGKRHSQKNINLFRRNSSGKNNPMYGTLGGMYGKQQSKKQKDNQSKYKKNWWSNIERNTSKIRRYRNQADAITRKQPIHLLENYDKRGVSGTPGAYQLDHIKSIWYGYHHKIRPKDIGNISNLRFIPWLENQKKWKYCI